MLILKPSSSTIFYTLQMFPTSLLCRSKMVVCREAEILQNFGSHVSCHNIANGHETIFSYFEPVGEVQENKKIFHFWKKSQRALFTIEKNKVFDTLIGCNSMNIHFGRSTHSEKWSARSPLQPYLRHFCAPPSILFCDPFIFTLNSCFVLNFFL